MLSWSVAPLPDCYIVTRCKFHVNVAKTINEDCMTAGRDIVAPSPGGIFAPAGSLLRSWTILSARVTD